MRPAIPRRPVDPNAAPSESTDEKKTCVWCEEPITSEKGSIELEGGEAWHIACMKEAGKVLSRLRAEK